ncbi:SDR family NAD(P)-dependent oxidoreductase [Hoeflea sp. BAL378]|uniref:SDR family NAD(P)-dependent oxidoreductase n=1 Tax=Hoeflea sp. BAL378 TaxID=1547437 RepID=UPI00068AFB6B|nr:SDR family NAD(P)-dependent oxidoreductase [Hoeflea sp. BAL378]
MSADFKVAVVSGAGRGIAKNVALALVRSGYAVAVLDIDEQSARETVAEAIALGGQAIACPADISNETHVEQAIAAVLDRWDRIDLLVNAAGSHGMGFRKTHETPLDEWQHVLASNLTGYFLCAKHCLATMMRQKSGRIINFSSNAGRSVSPLLGASYTAAKAGVIGLTRHLAHEYASHGILVNTIAPGPVDGERVDKLLQERGGSKELARSIPLGRLATEDDVRDVVLFLASDASRFMTGAILDVNGGYVLA